MNAGSGTQLAVPRARPLRAHERNMREADGVD